MRTRICRGFCDFYLEKKSIKIEMITIRGKWIAHLYCKLPDKSKSKALVSRLCTWMSFLFILVDWNWVHTKGHFWRQPCFILTGRIEWVLTTGGHRGTVACCCPSRLKGNGTNNGFGTGPGGKLRNFILDINVGQLALTDTVSSSTTLPAAWEKKKKKQKDWSCFPAI